MKWITITPDGTSKSGKTRQWVVASKESSFILGYVRWHAAWKKYAFMPAIETVFEWDCLKDIAGFVESSTREHYENLKARTAKGADHAH